MHCNDLKVQWIYVATAGWSVCCRMQQLSCSGIFFEMGASSIDCCAYPESGTQQIVVLVEGGHIHLECALHLDTSDRPRPQCMIIFELRSCAL
jgi:hypothetical protein